MNKFTLNGKEYSLRDEDEATMEQLSIAERARAIIAENIDKVFKAAEGSWEEYDRDVPKLIALIQESWKRFVRAAFLEPDEFVLTLDNIKPMFPPDGKGKITEAMQLFFKGSMKADA